MSAGGALQEVLAARLAGIAELSGVYDGPPARAAYPYAVIDAASESDWSHKNGTGREVMFFNQVLYQLYPSPSLHLGFWHQAHA